MQSIYSNVFYLGDAFYTFSPALAQGASQSIESAYELFNLILENKKNIKNLYFKKRLKKTNLVNNRSKLNYFSFHLSNSLIVKIRNFIIKKISKSDKYLNYYLRNIYQKN